MPEGRAVENNLPGKPRKGGAGRGGPGGGVDGGEGGGEAEGGDRGTGAEGAEEGDEDNSTPLGGGGRDACERRRKGGF